MLFRDLDCNHKVTNPVYYVTVLMGLFNVCGNPFIYATKYDVVKKKLKKLVGRGQVASA